MAKDVYSLDINVAREAGRRWKERTPEREGNLDKLAAGGISAVESPERLAKRANILMDKVRAMPAATAAMPADVAAVISRGVLQPHDISGELIERVIGATRDFLSIDFLERAIYANRSVGRIVTRLGPGRNAYGTGFLVSPRLVLTNWHVLTTEQDAANSLIEFDYQLDRTGNGLPVSRFQLDPATFFVNDKALDFALVAVRPVSDRGRNVADFGFLRLIAEEGKALKGEPVNIIQHPRGRMKEVALRANQLLDLPENTPFAHYACDTEPGSSGSPVFNDEWDVVALHHSAVPEVNDNDEILDIRGNVWDGNDPDDIHWIANEGIRVSRLVSALKSAQVADETQKDLLAEALSATAAEPAVVPRAETDVRPDSRSRKPRAPRGGNAPQAVAQQASSASVTLTLPVTVTVSIGQPQGFAASAATAASDETAPPVFAEAIKPDPDYDNRPGYDPFFLDDKTEVPLPEPAGDAKKAALVVDPEAENPYELKYYHYSVIMNEPRKLAFVAACNYDPDAEFFHEREGSDRWFYDERIDKEDQAGPALYTNNPLDRGHLVRRADAAWGETEEEARLANDDTFHWSNCSPQHEVFNQSSMATKRGLNLWGNLENHVAEQAQKDSRRLCIYNGPIFRENDRKHRGIRIPKEFWKVIVFRNDKGKLTALAFILGQASLIKNLKAEEFEVGPFAVFQVKLSDVEKKTGLSFSKLKKFESPAVNESMLESAADPRPLESLGDVVL